MQQELLVVTGAQNVRFEGVHYEYASVRQALNCLPLVEQTAEPLHMI